MNTNADQTELGLFEIVCLHAFCGGSLSSRENALLKEVCKILGVRSHDAKRIARQVQKSLASESPKASRPLDPVNCYTDVCNWIARSGLAGKVPNILNQISETLGLGETVAREIEGAAMPPSHNNSVFSQEHLDNMVARFIATLRVFHSEAGARDLALDGYLEIQGYLSDHQRWPVMLNVHNLYLETLTTVSDIRSAERVSVDDFFGQLLMGLEEWSSALPVAEKLVATYREAMNHGWPEETCKAKIRTWSEAVHECTERLSSMHL